MTREAGRTVVPVEEPGLEDAGRDAVHVYLPAEVELRTTGQEIDVDAIAEHALIKLARALESA